MRHLTTTTTVVSLLLLVVGAASASAETIAPPSPWWGITTGSRPTDLRPGVASGAEVQEVTVSATEGDWAVGENAASPGAVLEGLVEQHDAIEHLLPFDAKTAEVQKLVESVDPAKTVEVTGGPKFNAAHEPEGTEWTYVITFPEQGKIPPVTAESMTFTASCELLEQVNFGAPGSCGSEPGKVFKSLGGGAKAEPEVTVKGGEGKPDGQLFVEAENLGDATANPPTECVKVAGTGHYNDSACTEVNLNNAGEFEPRGKEPVSITDTLPAGLSAVSAEGVEGPHISRSEELGEVRCTIASSRKQVTCVYEAGLPAFEQIEILIGVLVDEGPGGAKQCEQNVPECEVNTATVSGGGATRTRTATQKVEVDGTERFGVEDYTLTPEAIGGSFETQAGSHPFQLTSVITANSTYNLPGTVRPRTVALPKDYDGALPPGLVGNPTPFAQCNDAQFAERIELPPVPVIANKCPAESAVGVAVVRYAEPTQQVNEVSTVPIFNMVPLPGEPARFAFKVGGFFPVFLNAGVRAGGDYGVTISSHNIIQTAWLQSAKLTFWGVPGAKSHEHQRGWECLNEVGSCPRVTESATPPPLLIMPSSCAEPFASTLDADSWPAEGKPSESASATYQLPQPIVGCNHLPFSPSITAEPDLPDASSATGLKVDVHVPQSSELNPEGLAESSVRGITVKLPEGVQVNPAGGNGLASCSEGLVGYEGEEAFPSVPGATLMKFKPYIPEDTYAKAAVESGLLSPSEATLSPGINFCANAAKIGTVRIKTPLLKNELEGAVYLADQNANPFSSLVALYIVAEDPVSGTVVKLPGRVYLCNGPGETIAGMTCDAAGQLITTFENSPQLPFEDATLHFFGGERAPLATPAHCGTYQTSATFAPWSGEAPVSSSAPFTIEHGPNGGPCPGASLPFSPSFTGGSTNLNAGSFSPLTGTFGREDGEQQMARVSFTLPPGLSGLISSVQPCAEAQANNGTCGPESLIGETTVTAGVGSDPVAVTGGKVFITGPYHGAPFGLSIVDPVKAGPFDLEHDTANPNQDPACDCVVVRAKIEINPYTSALTITSNSESQGYAIPHLIDGIPVQIKRVNFTTTRHDFQFNPTNCAPTKITGTVESDEGATSNVKEPFQVTNCKVLDFSPKFSVSTSGKTSKTNGASLTATVSEPAGSLGTQANLTKVKVELPRQLPSRLTTLQKACTSKQFEANPAGCPPESDIGYAVVHTPLLPVPLEGPAIFVSHGGEAFPSLTMVLQGDNVKIDLVGATFISKAGVTSTTFKTVPDQPFSSFSLTLHQGKFSALAALGNLCSLTKTVTVKKKVTVTVHGHKKTVTRKVEEQISTSLQMPTEFVAQNGAELKQVTPIRVTGCGSARPKHKAAKKAKHGKR